MDHSPPVVVQLLTEVGTILIDPAQIAQEFRRFYSDLYASRANHSPSELHSLQQNIDFPSLTDSQVELLEAPITEECITEAIACLPPSKALGSDGLPSEFYSQFQEVLLPKLQALYSHIHDSGTLLRTLGEALIVLIPKPGKDPLYPESYRPISLLQLDVKILAKNSCP